MDQATLVDEQKEDGRKLIARLVEEGVPVIAAAWLRGAEDGMWFLYLVTPLVPPEGGTAEAYRRLLRVFKEIPQPFSLDPIEVKVIGVDSPLAKALAEINHRNSGPARFRLSSFRVQGIEGSFIYSPLPTLVR